jgi:hypothetical protein
MPTKHESTNQPGLFFWAEEVPPARGEGPTCWMVVQQATGFPGTSAYGDWLAHQKDADEIAQLLSRGEPVS